MENNVKKLLEYNISKIENENNLENDNKPSKFLFFALILEIVVNLIGWVLLFMYVDWTIYLAIMLIMWGNNLMLFRKLYDIKKKLG
jgi:hypothetical protein